MLRKYKEHEEEFLSEDGIFFSKGRERFDNAEKCCHCGFELLPGEEVITLFGSGDIIHKNCWNEYADENTSYFGKCFVYSEGE